MGTRTCTSSHAIACSGPAPLAATRQTGPKRSIDTTFGTTFLTMIANVDAHKITGVRKHEADDDTPAVWVAQTLASLKRLQANDQAQLTLHLKELTKGRAWTTLNCDLKLVIGLLLSKY